METKVRKRNGLLENFDSNKIIQVVTAAGLETQQAEKLTKTIENWLKSLKQQSISSLKIRDQVSQNLKSIDPHAYNMYRQYQQSKQ